MTLHRFVHGYGTIEPAPATPDQPAAGGPISSPTAGVVAKVKVVAGQEVKAGDVLVELNSSTASFNYAKAEVERQKQLFANQNTSLKNLQDAEAQLASMQITAPVSGTVTRLSAKAGAAIDANVMVAEVIDLNHLAVSTQVPAEDGAQIKLGQPLQIGESTTTSVSFVSPAIATADNTISILAMVPPNSGLRPGAFVPIKIVTDTRANCLVAPAESVVTGEDGKSFIVVAKGAEAAQVEVKAGLRENGWVEIEGADLKEGATVVTVGAYGFPKEAKIRDAKAVEKESASTNAAPEK
jgi:multidrug efflux pump subunit AcrA (membrane-fusion protein)